MSIRYEVDGKLLRLTFEGSTAQEDFYQVVHVLFTERKYDDDAVILSDLRASTSLATRGPQVVEMLSEFVLCHPGRPGEKVAVLLQRAERERLASSIDFLAKKTGVQIETFEDEPSALAWLGFAQQNEA